MKTSEPAQLTKVYRRTGKRGHAQGGNPGVERCQIKKICGSCKFVNTDYATSLNEKHQAGLAILEKAKLLGEVVTIAPVASPKQFQYRTHAKLAVRTTAEAVAETIRPSDRAVIGLFQPNSHATVSMAGCPLHVFSITKLVRVLPVMMEEAEISPYSDKTGKGELRYVAIRGSHLTTELMVTFVVTTPIKDKLKLALNLLRNEGYNIKSAHMNINSERGNAIYGQETHLIAGRQRLRQRICEMDLEIGPTSFFQINPSLAEILYHRVAHIAGSAGASATAWDFYCGTGQIGIMLAKSGYRVLGIEEIAGAVADAKINASKNGVENRLEFLTGRVETLQENLPPWATNPNVIVVNPSRKGLKLA
jgi:23S rRNA (uracil1939-C5)-methyltransferase